MFYTYRKAMVHSSDGYSNLFAIDTKLFELDR